MCVCEFCEGGGGLLAAAARGEGQSLGLEGWLLLLPRGKGMYTHCTPQWGEVRQGGRARGGDGHA